MVVEDENFTVHKQNAVNKFKEALDKKQLDSKIINLLNKINSFDNFFTTSSCAGRIVVLQLPEIGDKKNAVFLGCWHRQVDVTEVVAVLDSYTKDQIWLLTQPPIFHIGCKSLSAANELLTIGFSSGFKHSGIRSVSSQIIVELQSTERVDMPLGQNGIRMINDDLVSFLVNTANKALRRAQDKLDLLEEKINTSNL